MNDLDCRRLDDYLSRALSADEEVAFALHLQGCRACRQAAEEQEVCDRLLRQAVTQQPVPERLVARIRARIRRVGRRRRLARTAGLAASLLLAGLCLWWVNRSAPEHQPGGLVVKEQPPAPAQPDPRKDVEVRFAGAVIVVPVKTSRPNMTILWVYPSVQSAENAQAESTDPERNGT